MPNSAPVNQHVHRKLSIVQKWLYNMQTRDAFHITGFQSLSLKTWYELLSKTGGLHLILATQIVVFFLTDAAVYETSRSVVVKIIT